LLVFSTKIISAFHSLYLYIYIAM